MCWEDAAPSQHSLGSVVRHTRPRTGAVSSVVTLHCPLLSFQPRRGGGLAGMVAAGAKGDGGRRHPALPPLSGLQAAQCANSGPGPASGTSFSFERAVATMPNICSRLLEVSDSWPMHLGVSSYREITFSVVLSSYPHPTSQGALKVGLGSDFCHLAAPLHLAAGMKIHLLNE